MKKLKLLLFVMFTTFALVACDDNDGMDVRPDQVPSSVTRAFAEKFPNAVMTEWEKHGSQYKVEFSHEGMEMEAWYNADGTWTKTEAPFYGVLPEAVQQYIATTYAGYRVEDVDLVEVPNDSYYEIELEKNERLDFLLLIHPDGTPLN